MRILHVLEVAHGGVVSLVRTYAELQSARGHEVHVLAPEDAGEFSGARHRWAPDRRKPWSLASAVRRLSRLSRDLNPDTVHLHSFLAGAIGRVAPRPGPWVVVYQPHSWAFELYPSAMARRSIVAFERWAQQRTDTIVVNCADEGREGLAEGITAPVVPVGLPVDVEHFAPRGDPNAPRRDLGVTTRHLLVCVGRLSRQKGQVRLAETWERRAPEDTTLALVGPGDPDEVRSAAPTTYGRSLLWAGPQDDVRPWLWAADLGVQPSLYEGQSVAMAEALACGLPLVMTEVNGAREAVAPEGEPAAGAVVPHDMDALLDAVDVRLAQPYLRSQESRAARDRAVVLFHPDRVMERLESVYTSSEERRA